MLPPVGLPYRLPHPPRLRQPGPALREEVVAGLLLFSPASTASVIRRLVDRVPKVRAYRRMAGQELVVSASMSCGGACISGPSPCGDLFGASRGPRPSADGPDIHGWRGIRDWPGDDGPFAGSATGLATVQKSKLSKQLSI